MLPANMATSIQKLGHVCVKHNIRYLLRHQIWKLSNQNISKNGVHTSSMLWCSKPAGGSTPTGIESKPETGTSSKKAEKISKAMKVYMERSKAHDSMIKEQVVEYELGKRHLANIMGEDPDSFEQEDIDRAIKYLLPSGLYEKKARPVMKHPYEVFPKRKAAQFSIDGRPHHFLFYTGQPNYYNLLHDITTKFESLRYKEQEILKKGLMAAESEKKLSLHGYQWMEKEDLEKKLIEQLSPQDYSRFVVLMDRLLEHSLAYKEEEFLLKYARRLTILSQDRVIQKPHEDEDGRQYMKSYGKRKTSHAYVTVYNKGTGVVTINGQDLSYFKNVHDREQLLFPLQVVNKIDNVDIHATVRGGGPSGQAGAIRLGIAKSLCSFLDIDAIERLRLAGLLTKDPRRRERKKPGQAGARRKFTWKKR